MKAVIQTRYGGFDDLEVKEVEKPTPKDDEVLVRVHAASVHPDVWHVLAGQPYFLRIMGSGLLRPKYQIPGTDMAGIVEAVGKQVTQLKAGDEVFGETLRGHQWKNGGAYAEYVAVPEDILVIKPSNISFKEAAAIPTSAMIAHFNLHLGELLKPGDHILINGAGGGVGNYAVQIAKAYGAEVTAVDNPSKLNYLKSIGTDHFIDYTKENFTEGSTKYDMIFDIPGNHPFSSCRRVIKESGVYVLIGHDRFGEAGRKWFGSITKFIKLMTITPFMRQLPKLDFSMPDKKTVMEALKKLIEEEKLISVIDKSFPLDQVPEAYHYLHSGNPCGRIVISLEQTPAKQG